MEIEPEVLVRSFGTGFGTPEGLESLAAGQLRKRLVLLRMLVRDAEELTGPYQYVRSVPSLLAYPHLGVWIVHCLRRIASPSASGVPLWADLGYLGWLAAAHRITSGWVGRADVVVRDGEVMLPGLGLARLASPGTHGTATLNVPGTGVASLETGGTRVELDEGDPRWLPLRRLGRTVLLDDIDPFRDLSDPYARAQLESAPPRLSAAEASAWSAAFDEAQEILREQYPDYADGVERILRAVVPLTASPVANGVSNTSFHAFGAVNMSAAAGPHQFALSLIHECQHAKLSALTDQIELQKPSTLKDLYAPWRDDPRPLSGLLQGIYAHIGVTDFWRVYRRSAGPKSLMANIEFARWRSQVVRALAVAGASPLLTAEGIAFVSAMTEATAAWAGEEVPEQLEMLAEECSIGHFVAWRVRNLRVAEGDLLALRDRWKARLDAGTLPASHLGPPAAVPKSSRSRLPVGYVKMNSLAGQRAGTPASDTAYVEGRYEEALALFALEPESPSKWAGIALCLHHLSPASSVTALLDRAEVVSGLHALTAASPGDLTAWLSRG
jgi:HEXXH motif-containing protein